MFLHVIVFHAVLGISVVCWIVGARSASPHSQLSFRDVCHNDVLEISTGKCGAS